VDFVAVAEDERSHLWVPETGLVTEVDTGFQHFTHSYGHFILQGYVWNPLSHPCISHEIGRLGTLFERIRV
jgi:hypothetical protein